MKKAVETKWVIQRKRDKWYYETETERLGRIFTKGIRDAYHFEFCPGGLDAGEKALPAPK